MEKLLSRYFVALFLLSGLIVIVLGQTCGPNCFGKSCSLSKKNCPGPCKCQQFSAGDKGTCVACLTASCQCSVFTINDAPMRSCCPGLKCSNPNANGQGTCKK